MYADFQEKSLHRFLNKTPKLFIEVKFDYNEKFMCYFQKYTQRCPVQNSVYHASHCSALRIECLTFLRHLYLSIFGAALLK